MTEFVISDFESTLSGVIHTICLIPVKLSTTVTRKQGVLIIIKDVIGHPDMSEALKVDGNQCKKIGRTIIDASVNNLKIEHLNFYNAVTFMIGFIESHGGGIMNHNLLEDLGFLVNTQNFVGGKRIIKNNLKEHPDIGIYDKRWENFTKTCSMSLINNRCLNFNKNYQTFCNKHSTPPTETNLYYPSKLETFTQFVKNDFWYKQSHSAVQDTIDLLNIVKSVVDYDGKNIFDGHTYLVPVKKHLLTSDYIH